MNYEYYPSKLESKYTDPKYLKKKYGSTIQSGMNLFINAVEAAETAYDIKAMPQFYMEHKHGNLKEYYFVSLDKKKSKWRLPLQMLDENNKILIPTDNEKEFLKKVKKIRIKELSEHYDEY